VIRCASSLALLVFCVITTASAQSAPPPDAPKLSVSGYLQPQFEVVTAEGETRDRALLRRLLLIVDASLPNAWTASVQLDVGPVASGGDRLIVKDAYLRYTGLEDRGLLLTIGNQKMPFSRSLLASASRRSLVERPLAADRAFGSPARALAVKVDGWHRKRTLYWSAALASSRQSPDPDEIRLHGTAEAEDGWNQGPLLGGRLEFHPNGEVPRAQGDFDRNAFRVTVGAGAYSWWNDGDEDRHGAGTVDADRIAAIEISGGLRGHGLSVDAEFAHLTAESVAGRATLGLYQNGSANINKGSIEAGYMVVPRHVEALVGLDALDAQTFDVPWRRAILGLNWYLSGHALKFSVMHRESFDERGVNDARSHTTYVQAQIAF
jgi:hypothetical protein